MKWTPNVKGFNSPQKQKKAFRYYKTLGADIILLQETHFSSNNHPKYFDKAYKHYHFTTFESKSRGVAIFIKNTVLFDIHHL